MASWSLQVKKANNLPSVGDVVDWYKIITNDIYRGHITCWLGNDRHSNYHVIQSGPALLLDIEDPGSPERDVVYLTLLTTAGTFRIVVFAMSYGRVEGYNAIMLRRCDEARFEAG